MSLTEWPAKNGQYCWLNIGEILISQFSHFTKAITEKSAETLDKIQHKHLI